MGGRRGRRGGMRGGLVGGGSEAGVRHVRCPTVTQNFPMKRRIWLLHALIARKTNKAGKYGFCKSNLFLLNPS